MKVTNLHSMHNPHIKALLKLQKQQSKTSSQEFAIEGNHFCELANKKHYLLSLWLTPERYANLKWVPNSRVKIYVISEAMAQKIGQVVHSAGVVGVCEKPRSRIDYQSNFLLIDDLQDPGNLGTLMRSAAAFGFPNVVTSLNTVSFYNPKVLRATQGLIFNLNLLTTDLKLFCQNLKQRNCELIGTFLRLKSDSLAVRTLNRSTQALLLGNEARGLNQKWLEVIDSNILIPMSPDVESLNVAVAGSIIMHDLNQI